MSAAWYELRPARNRKPVTYTCPLCLERLPSLVDHVLLVPEGDRSRRRHAHTACVLAARRDGSLLTREEWRRAQQPVATGWRRLLGRR